MFKKLIKEQDTIHFIIHPEFARGEHEKFNEYYAELHSFFSNLQKSFIETNCFLIKTEYDTDFTRLIPQQNQFSSYTHSNGLASGNIGEEDWSGFKNIADRIKDKKIIFHGSYLGFCVRGFVIQLATYYYISNELARETFTPSAKANDIERQQIVNKIRLRNKLLSERLNQKKFTGRFFYGNVLSLHSDDLVKRSPTSNIKVTDFDWIEYFMDSQMTDKNTKIFF